MVSIRPTNGDQIETVLEDSNRFDDISQLIYFRNEEIFKRYLKEHFYDQQIISATSQKPHEHIPISKEKNVNVQLMNQSKVESTFCIII